MLFLRMETVTPIINERVTRDAYPRSFVDQWLAVSARINDSTFRDQILNHIYGPPF